MDVLGTNKRSADVANPDSEQMPIVGYRICTLCHVEYHTYSYLVYYYYANVRVFALPRRFFSRPYPLRCSPHASPLRASRAVLN